MKATAAIAGLVIIFALSATTFGQQSPVRRTILKSDKFDFGPGGTIVIGGYPVGSIEVEGTPKSQIELEVEITIEAPSESDADRIAKVVGFTLDESSGRVAINSLGPFNRKYLKKADVKFPNNLLSAPVRIDYRLKVPRFGDLQIDGGKGNLRVKGIDGSMRINFLEPEASIELIGGSLNGVFGVGNVSLSIPDRGWRGRYADVQLSRGILEVNLPAGLNAELDAVILRSGSIDNKFPGLTPRSRRDEFTERTVYAKAGNGGIPLKFSVGEGEIRLFTYGVRR